MYCETKPGFATTSFSTLVVRTLAMAGFNGSYPLNHHSLVGSGGSTHTGHVSVIASAFLIFFRILLTLLFV